MKENKGIIHLRGMEFYAYHGVLPEENAHGQIFVVDVDIVPMEWPLSDQIENTINYAEVYQAVKACMSEKNYQLIETVAEVIAKRILKDFICASVRVEVHKPQAPIDGIFSDVSVEVVRSAGL